MGLFTVIAEGERALVTSPSGRRRVVDGPARVLAGWRSAPFVRRVLMEDERGTLVDESGVATRVEGPRVVWVHPQGTYRPDTMVHLARHEAVVVIGRDGRYRVERGSENPAVWVTADERLHEFKWTGSKGDTDFKTPGTLRVTTLRLQDTQTYVGYTVRTKDNMVATVHLMLSFHFTDIEKLLGNDDPLGQMYNRIMADISSHVAAMSFDDFKSDTATQICGIPLFSADRNWFEGLGLALDSVALREWRPVDARVQAVLEQAATANAQKAVDEANHARRMAQIKNDEAVLDGEAKLEDKRLSAAVAQGRAEGAAIAAVHTALSKEVGGDAALRLSILKVASKASTLCLPPEMLSGS